MRTDARTTHRPITHGLVLIAVSLVVGYATITGGALGSKTPAFAAPVTGLSLPGVSSSIPAVDQTTLRPPAINRTTRAAVQPSAKQQEVKEQLATIYATPTAQPPAVQEDAVVRAASVAPTPALPPYQVHQVEQGETVGSIAARFGISAEYVLANNAEIRDSDFLKLGQSIIVPVGNGILHEVRYGETLSDIAARYDVPVGEITQFSANHIATPDDITETQLVFVPNGKPVLAAVPAAQPVPTDSVDQSTPQAGSTPKPTDSAGDAGSSSGSSNASRKTVGGGSASSEGLIWPVSGPISSYYGPSHPLGIDIDGFNLAGASIAAATSGTVIFAGGNACCSYGLYVVVMSSGGIETLYAHLSSISVSQGETVSQGEELGIIGSTGYSTGRHLHFEVIDNGVRKNPTSYLP